ncbi:histone deacetylase complex subunit SAP30 homolog [Stomoxys calcitrans]|uniref:Histone deacetylase complex subunit SAP30 Sin3 binding domain-containing protein n=1 Tax=Stomoxys calcitrans TaxID=35570 RepID=A0A1I8NSX1_STOCA|nr:histone deacetylase complex subunit SAP30 homolog [Stomoxys calcitrans]
MNNGFSTEEDSRGGHADQTCCLIDDTERCRNPAGNASYSKRIQKTSKDKRLKLSSDPTSQHIYICDYHKDRIQSARSKRRRKESEDDSNDTDIDLPEVPDLYQLQVNTLKRYKRHYKLQTRPGVKRAQLADTIMKHFKTIPIKEKEIITYFVYMVKSNSNKLDL